MINLNIDNVKPAEPVIKPVKVPEVKPKTPWTVPGPKVNPKPRG